MKHALFLASILVMGLAIPVAAQQQKEAAVPRPPYRYSDGASDHSF
jgi:hypothetical protein